MKSLYAIVSNKPFKIFYNGLVPRKIRKQWHLRYDVLTLQQEIASYWQQMISDYDQHQLQSHTLKPKKTLDKRPIVWQYWGQGLSNLPDTAKMCFDTVDKHAQNCQIIRITDETVHEYLDLPDFVQDRRNQGFRPVFFSDLLRVALIHTYGGIWLDASVLLIDTLPLSYLDYEFFIFSRDPSSVNKAWGADDTHFYFNWRNEFKVKHLSSIMYGKAQTPLSTILWNLLLYYWKTQEDIKYYFFFQVLIQVLYEQKPELFNFPTIDDTLPHLLQSKMNQPFDASEYRFILDTCPLQKLSLHDQYQQKTLFNKKTFFGWLAENNNRNLRTNPTNHPL